MKKAPSPMDLKECDGGGNNSQGSNKKTALQDYSNNTGSAPQGSATPCDGDGKSVASRLP